ncbi:hypothetical protein [Mahella sp.]|uniref:hypothetical protein n=1 Tax=Mahella sp. TaxID=2798721 RepID=UPI0025BCE9D8|nr:hypothetical protein [Mahella sp.]MBZ4665006.1 putative rane protein [Mahella sp.]
MVKRGKVVMVFIICIILIMIIVSYIAVRDFSLADGKYTFVTITHGTTGNELTITNSTDVDKFVSELNTSCGKLSGVDFPSMGYQYKIVLSNGDREEELYIKSENRIKNGLFEYELDRNFVVLIDNFLKALEN